MTADELAQIEARHRTYFYLGPNCQSDVEALIAEVRRLNLLLTTAKECVHETAPKLEARSVCVRHKTHQGMPLCGEQNGLLSQPGDFITCRACLELMHPVVGIDSAKPGEDRTVKMTVDFCNWCPDPTRPSSESHPNGQVEHMLNEKPVEEQPNEH